MALCRPRNMNDEAYNAERIVATGNPCKGFVADLIKRGMQIELCARPAKAHKSGTADLLPGVNVNTDAMARIGATRPKWVHANPGVNRRLPTTLEIFHK